MAGAPGSVSSYNIAPGESADSASLRRKIAYQLMMQGTDTSPVQHWTQGAARVAQSLMGGMELAQMDKKEQADKAAGRSALVALLGGGAEGNAQPASTAPVSPVAPRNLDPGRVYSANEPSPLDPPSGQDRDLAIRTILAEAGNQGPTGMQAVGNVIRNRAVSGTYGGDTPSQVVTAPNQFEPWNTRGGRQQMASIDPNSPRYQQASSALDQAYTGDDPTKGAVNFFAPKAQAQLGRPVPAWGRQGGQDIGDHRFFGGAQGAVGAPVDQPRGGMTPERRTQLIAALANTPGIGGAIAQSLVMKQLDKEQNQVRPLSEQEKGVYPGAVALEANGKPVFPPPSTNVQLSTVANPVLEGVGKQVVDQRKAAQTAASETIPYVHEARKALDGGAITGAFAEGKVGLAKIGNLFGLGNKDVENTEVLRSAVGNQVLGHIKALGANPSNADRDYIEKVQGGQIALEEGSMRKMLDMTEKYARQSVKNFNRDAQKLMGAQPDSYKGIAPLMSVDEPGQYQAPAAAATGQPVKVSTPEEARKLPKGTPIILPDGSPGVVP